eukprot:51163_1
MSWPLLTDSARFRRLKISVAALLLVVLVLFGVAALVWFLIMNGHVYNLLIFSDVGNSEPSGAAMPWELFSKVANRAPPAANVLMSQWALARAPTSLEDGLTSEAKQELTDSTGRVIKLDLKSLVEHHLPVGGATFFSFMYFRSTWKEPLTGGSGACMNFTAPATEPNTSGVDEAEEGVGDKVRSGPQLMQAEKLSGTEFFIFDNNSIAMWKKMRTEHFSVTFIMPHEPTPLLKFIDNFTDAKWAKLLDIFDHCDDSTLCVERLVWLPRAKMVTKNLKLRDILEDMGVRRAFNVTDEVNMTDKPVKVAEVFQNAVFSYDDTKSKTIQNLNDVADSFGNIIDGIGEMFAEKPQKPPTRPVRFDRPFWVVVHYMDSVLMSGVVNQPDQCE